MLYAAALLIAVASVLVTQVAYRRAQKRQQTGAESARNSAYVMFVPVGLVIVGVALAAAAGASRWLAAVFFVAAFATALIWSVRTARPRH